jgi:acetyl-CoA carboxylase biotin carboxyl carrier protein
MDIKEIRELIELIQQSAVEEFEMEKSGVRIRIRKSLDTSKISIVPSSSPVSPANTEVLPETESEPEEVEKEDLHIFTAPIVGTYYITPKPDAEPFVQVGDMVSKSKVLCIIEAMKIFNQIECDVDGEIVSILVENGQPVEYGEPLFKIRLSS